MQFRAPRVLYAMFRPQSLLHRGRAGENNRIVSLGTLCRNGTGRMDLPLADVVDEGDVVVRVPIQRVEGRVEVHRLQ